MKLVLLILVLFSMGASAQSICISVDCKDTTRAPATSIILNGIVSSGEGVKSVQWTVVSGTATIDSPFNAVTTARGFSTGGIYVFRLSAISNKGATAMAYDSTVYMPPVITKKVTNTTQIYAPDGITVTSTLISVSTYYSDGTSTTINTTN
jgi:hypothetical protein